MTVLSKEEKVQLINSRARSLEYKKYGLELDILVENAKVSPDEDAVSVMENAVTEINTQINALSTELSAVNELSE